MPAAPSGEASLRALSERFSVAEARIGALVAQAPAGDRRALLTEALTILIALRREDFLGPVHAAYLDAFRAVRAGGSKTAAGDLAGSMAKKLDRGAQTASSNAKGVFRAVTAENVEEMAAAAVVAHGRSERGRP